ncbi:unnamed protein product [Urochloa humidicola]
MADGGQSPAPIYHLPDDLLVEILSRLPAKSLCRFKLVSRSWRTLIADPHHRRRFAQTLSGIFFSRQCDRTPWGFTPLTTPTPHALGDGALANSAAPISFLPSTCKGIELLDSCNGLLLLRCSEIEGSHGEAALSSPDPPPPAFYVVCNPATEEWVALPQPSLEPGYDDFSEKWEVIRTYYAALVFDPSVSSHYHVLQILEEQFQTVFVVEAVEIYSSETGSWVLRESGWERLTAIHGHNIYFNGFQHFITLYGQSVAMVDAKGQVWREIKFPCSEYTGFLGHSQGCLLYVDSVEQDGAWAVYALEDHGREEWTFKHRIDMFTLFGPAELRWPMFSVVTFHPDCDWIIYYDRKRGKLMSYDMNKGDVHAICTLREVEKPFLPYVPLYSSMLLPSLPDVK